MIVGELAITDGTTYIDLKSGAFRLVEWTPAIPSEKGGGIWNDSVLDDNRRPVMFKRGNAVETFQLRVVTNDMDDTIRETQELRRLLEKAKEYWTVSWQNTPVWIVARGNCETNTRYAYIVNYAAERDDDPYQSPFSGAPMATMDEFSLQTERFDWMSNPPGQGACVAVASQQMYVSGSGTDTASPTQSSDDIHIEITTGTSSLVNVDLYLGWESVVGVDLFYANGIRFRSVAIPAGATITYARIDVVASANESGGIVRWKVYGELNAAPAVFVNYIDFMTRTQTSFSVTNSTGASWTAGNTYTLLNNTSSARQMIQEIIDLPGWAAGNNLAVLTFNNGSTDRRRFASWDNVTYTEPILYLEWTTGETLPKGRAATCANEVYFANKNNVAQLTHAYYYDAAPVTWSANIIGAALPASLLPAVPAANDILYIGIETALIDSGPFNSVIFDIGTAATDIINGQWQYWNGGWVALTVGWDTGYDAIDGYFSRTGVQSVVFDQPADWVANAAAPAVPVTCYWIRFIVQAVGAAPTDPIQQNRDLYTVVRSSVDVDELQVAGDISALAQSYVYNWTGIAVKSVIMATRSASRGTDFRMYLNFSDEQNPTGVSANVVSVCAFATNTESPSGRTILYNPAGAGTGECNITLDTSVVNDFIGRYRCYLRVDVESAVVDCTAQLKLGIRDATGLYTSYYYESAVLPIDNAVECFTLDFGQIDIPGIGLVREGESIMPIVLTIDLANTGANPNLHLYDLILIPIDEWAGEFTIFDTGNNAEQLGVQDAPNYNYLDIDSLNLKRKLSAFVRYSGTNAVQYTWKDITSTSMRLQSNADQQVYCLMKYLYGASPDIWIVPEHFVGSIQLNAAARYLSMRGAR